MSCEELGTGLGLGLGLGLRSGERERIGLRATCEGLGAMGESRSVTGLGVSEVRCDRGQRGGRGVNGRRARG